MKFPLAWLLLNKWLWITILSLSAIVIGPFVVISLVLSLPSPELRALATFMIIFGWGIAAGFKDWVISKRNEERTKPYVFETVDEAIPRSKRN